MSLYELMLRLHRAFLASPSPKGKHRKKMGRIVQERNGFTQGTRKVHRKRLVWRQRRIMPKEVCPSYCTWWAPQLMANRCGGRWELTWFQNAMEQTHGKEIHEGHWYRATTFTSERPYARNSENLSDANEFVLVMFLYLSLGFSQKQSLEAESWAMWSFGLMQLFLFAPLAAAKSLNPTASQKASQRMIWTDTWRSSRLPELSSQAVCALRQASQLHCPVVGSFT